MKITIGKLHMKNFKGFEDKVVDFEHEDKSIYGQNETGKSTLFDAFYWLLFDKDSHGSSNFDLKRLDGMNNVIHGLDHIVEGHILIDGEKHVLKKVYQEKWTKPRGQSEEVFSGHTTDYYIDEEPVKKKDYDQWIDDLIKEDIFKMVANPFYFNDQIHWKDRRNVFMDMIGDVDKETVISSNKNLKKYREFLEDSEDIDKQKKIIRDKIKKLNDDIEDIPPRIDELENSKETIDMTEGVIEARRSDYQEQLDNINDQINDKSKVGEKKLALKNELIDLREKLSKLRRQQKKDIQEDINVLEDQQVELEKNIRNSQKAIKGMDRLIGYNKKMIEQKEEAKQKLVKEYKETKALEFDGETKCPYCGQDLPEDQMDKKKEKFEKSKSKELERINSRGKELKEEIKEYEKEIKESQEIIDNETELKEKEEKKLKRIKEALAKENEKLQSLEPTDEMEALNEQIEELKNEIDNFKQPDLSDLKAKRREIKEEIQDLERKLMQLDQNEKIDKRIRELMDKEKKIAKKIAVLEQKEFACEEYIVAKVDMIQQKVDVMFDNLSVKMFEKQVNGGIKTTCEVLVKNDKGVYVPFSSANNAGRINAGVEVINALCHHYGVYVPIFIDNAEAVNQVLPSESQMIKLYVTDDDQKLRIV